MVMAYIAMTYIVMAYIVMAYIAMTYIVMASTERDPSSAAYCAPAALCPRPATVALPSLNGP